MKNHKLTRRVLLSATGLACMMAANTASAKPAYPGIVTLDQPDGTQIAVRLQGDEYAHRILSEDGHLLLADDQGMLCYATLQNDKIANSGIRAHSLGKRSASENSWLLRSDRNGILKKSQEVVETRRSKAFAAKNSLAAQSRMTRADDSEFDYSKLLFHNSYPTTGNTPALIILVEYPDCKFQDDALDYFQRMTSEKDFSDNGGTGSVLDYFTANSLGKFTPQFDVYGPVMLKNGRAYYGRNDSYGNDQHPEEMVIEGCDALDDEVDFSKYDTDGDGYIDNVYVFYAGRGEADGGGSTTVWPHSWNIEQAAGIHKQYDGVKLDRYACSNEIDNMTRLPDGIGTFVHEYSHVLGLPDLYATDYGTSCCTPGSWSVLDYGPYNNDGRTPPNYSVFERYALGWLTPNRFNKNGEMELPPITDNIAYKVDTERTNEFFLIEKREKVGFDAYLPYFGMLVWYIDYNKSDWDYNTVNNQGNRQRVDLIEADGNSKGSSSSDGSSFPGLFDKTEFTLTSTPAFKCRLGKGVGVEFTNIYQEYDWENDDADGTEPLILTVKTDFEDPAGVDNITQNGAEWSLQGLRLNAPASVDVYTTTGLKIGSGNCSLPAPGLYIIGGKKVMVK